MIKREIKPTYKNIMEVLISLRKQRNNNSAEERKEMSCRWTKQDTKMTTQEVFHPKFH